MKVLIFEDEIPAYDKLISFIEKHLQDAEIKGWGRSINEAKRLLQKYDDVQLIFSDIELLDGSSLNIYEDISINCPIIFCTAFDQYVLQAFQTNGIAYLLKPYDDDKFKEAIEKYKTLFSGESKSNISSALIKDINAVKESQVYKQRFTVKKKGGIKLITTSSIVSFKASGDFSFAIDNKNEKHIINYSLGDIESKLDPGKFFRINRSEIINIEFIEKIEPYFKNRLSIKMQGSQESINTSTAKTPDFRNWIDK
jgi:DNA-binding LytR/AlgR family response regulator